ncbi:hypothetical protein C8F04DRAFT_1316584 [Mycena alexandri]|uniref:Uncharacterized protein n=1 Tax=Mycena alexandri TaxID=1745969 RepID=A0AAD6S402_9AGAR|nr:hypothetical protein C8F04DRAFT_1316584 [Mycena alexandri]
MSDPTLLLHLNDGREVDLHMLNAEPTPPKRKKKKRAKHADVPQNFLSPQSGRIAAFTTQQPTHFAFESPPKPEKKPSKPTGGRRLGIKQSAHPPEAGWVSSGACLTVEAYKKFDAWKNDYQPKHYYYGKSIKLIHLGNPCDRQQDIRARPWILAWDTLDRNEPPELANKRVPVFRVVYHCSGHCRHGKDSDDSDDPSAKEGDEQEPDIDTDGYVDVDSDSPESESGAKSKAKPDLHSLSVSALNNRLNAGSVPKRKPPAKAECKVVLHAEVFSDDLSKLHFFQQHSHPETLAKYLEPSHYIRQCTLEMARTLGLSAASIKRRLLHLFDEDETPSYRRPDATQVNNIVNNARRKERLLSDPLLSIGAFAELNPDKVFRYTEPNYETDPPREFSTGIHHPYGTQVMLLLAWVNGVGLDSTYRHMNENRAPLTIMVTLDEKSRMVPGFAYLSSDTTIETQVTLLKETKKLVEKMARDLVEGQHSYSALWGGITLTLSVAKHSG